MDVRLIKKEVEALPQIGGIIAQFQQQWLRPVEKEFIQAYSSPVQQQLRQQARDIRILLQKLADQQVIQDKLHHHARQVLELKLSKLQQHTKKSQILARGLLQDKVFNIQQTIHDVQEMAGYSQELQQKAQELQAVLDEQGSLELQLAYHDLPHQRLFQELTGVCQKQQRLLQNLGKAFLLAVRE